MKNSKCTLLCAIMLILISGLTGVSTVFAQSWTSIDGGGTSGINTIAAATSIVPSVAVYNGSLYAIWCEMVSGKGQIHIKKYNGSTWVDAGTSGSQLDISTTGAENPKLVSYNGYLYAAWQEYDNGIYNIHVKQYNGSTWTFTQSYTAGDGRININHGTTANSQSVDILVFNNELYATWVEQSPLWQLRVAKFDGSYWSNIDGNGTNGLNYNTGYDAYLPRLGTYNNSLYLTWTETNSSGVKQLRVKRYDGSSVWTLIGGGANGLNYDVAQSPEAPILVSYNSYLYLFWDEYDNTTALKYKVRVKRYNGTSWVTDPDGGYGWHYNPAKTTVQPSACANNNLLYVSWEENKSPYQIRIVSFDGTTKTFIDGNDVSGINQNIAMRAHNPELIIKTGDLYAVWNEDNGGSDNAQQIRAKKYLLSPVVESVGVPANATYITGQALNFTINFSKNVNITSGSPYIPITLNTGGTVNAAYTGGTGTSTLTFSYTVASGNGDPDGISVGTAIAGATLQSQDAAPLTANLSLYNVGSTTGVLVDATGPTVTSVSSTTSDGYYNAGDVIAITITCLEAATVTGTPTLALNSGGTASYASGSGSTVLTFNYTVASGHNSADLDYSTTSALSLSGGTIKDGSGNDATLTLPTVGGASSLGGQKNIVIDNTAPTVTISSTASNPTNASPMPITITFSESVTGFVVGDISVTNGTAGSFSTVNAYTYTASITPAAAGTVAVNVAGSVATDLAGNNNTAATALTRVYDNVAPAAPTITGISAGYFNTNKSFTVSGEAGATIEYSTNNGGLWTAYSGAVTLSAEGTYIVLARQTDLAGNGPTASAVITLTIDKTAPAAPTITGISAGYFNANQTFTVGGEAGATIEYSTNNGGLWTAYSGAVTLSAEGTYNILARQTDQAGNGPTASAIIALTIDKTAPAAPTITGISAGYFKTNKSFTVSGEAGATIEYSTNNGGLWTAYSGAVTLSAEGTYYVLARQTDQAGNGPTASGVITLTLDKTAPAAPTVTGISAGYFNTNQTFTVGGEAGATIEYSTNNGGLWTAYSGAVTLSAEGTYNILARQTDQAGNGPTASGVITITIDKTAPTVTITSTATNPTNASFPVTITFSESVTGFVVGDISVTNGTAGSFSTINAYTYTANITPTAVGTITVNIAGSVATDAASNNNTAATALTKVYDNVAPTVTITSAASDPTNASPFPVTITFSESVTGFVVGDISVTNGTAGSFSTVNAYTYTANITPTTAGTVTVNISGSVVTDAAGNNNTAATALTRVYDNVAPTVIISSMASDPTNASIPVTITFSESVTGFVVGDISVTNGTAGSFSTVNAYTYTANITPTTVGTVIVNVAGSMATDAAGNNNTAATQLSRTFDNIAPTTTLSSTASEPTNVSPIPVTITFSKSVTGFAVGDIVVTNGTKSALNGGPAVYTIDITPSGQGVVSVNVATGVAQDAAGNNNTVASQLSRTFNNASPTVSITSTSSDPTNTSPIPVAITFSAAVTGFDESDITVVNGTKNNFSGSGSTYTLNITPSGQGVVTVDVAAGVAQDAANNYNLAATQLSRTFDNIVPSVSVSSTAPDPLNFTPVHVNITFSEAVTGFDVSDITVGNGTASNLQTSDNISWTADISPTGMGAFSVEIYAGVAHDLAGNGNTASAYFQRTYDPKPPTVTLSSTSPDPTNNNPIVVKIKFSETVWNFTLSDIIVGNGTASNLQMLDYHENWTVDITPASDGVVTVNIPAGAAQDYATNDNIAAIQFSRTCDITSPTVAISSTAIESTNTSPIPLTITFSEPVTGFMVGGIAVTNGTAGNFSGSGTTYTVDITPSGQGIVTVDIAAGVAQDALGNNNIAATQFSRTFDNIAPTVGIISTVSEPTNISPIPVTITFSESVTGFLVSDIMVTNGTVGNFSGSGTTYTANITPFAQGAVTIDIASGVAQDVAGNGNTMATQLSRTYDSLVPTVSIASSASEPTNTSPIPVTITFSESVTGFALGDITVTNGTVSSFSGSGTIYNADITPSGQGVVTVNIASGVAQDAAGNGNATTTQLSRTYDTQSPSVTISSTASNTTNVSPIPVTITFSESVTGFAVVDITVTNGTVGNFSGSGTTYTADITPSGKGTINVDVAGSVAKDAAGNNNTAATQWSIIYTTDYIISGNAGTAGVTLNYTDGTPKTVLADGSGAYYIIIPVGWSGTVTPSKTGYTFSADKVYTNVLSNQTSQDYTATAITYTISGHASVAGTTLSYTDGSAKTATADGSGNYSFTVSYNWSGTVSASKTGYTFSADKVYTNVLSNQTSQDYTATTITYTISGTAGVAGATLSYTDGSAKTATADASGKYSFTISYNWSGTVSASKTGYTFSADKVYSNVLSDQLLQDYIATVITDTRSIKESTMVIVYPTVNDGKFKLNIQSQENGKVMVKIFNFQGVTVDEFQYCKSLSSETFDVIMSKATIGMYTIEIRTNGHKTLQKIMVK